MEPFTIGVPLPIGFAHDPACFTAMHSDGSHTPVQVAALERWSDGSLKWVLVDLTADIVPGGFVSLHAQPIRSSDPALPPLIETSGEIFHATSGQATFTLDAHRFPFQDVRISGRSALDASASGLIVTDSHGNCVQTHVTGIALEANGSMRSVVRLEASIGEARDAGGLQLIARLHFFGRSPVVKFEVTLRNPRRAVHKGGFWELGDRGSIHVKDVRLQLALESRNATAIVRCSEEPGAPFATYSPPFVLYQDSSGGENWRSRAHCNRAGSVPTSFRGYTVTARGVERTGLRATPIVQLQAGRQALSVAMERFWQNFPKSIRVNDGALSLHLFSGDYADLHEIQGGEQKTHTFWVSFEEACAEEPALEWCRNPSRAIPDPAWCCTSGAVPFLAPPADDPHAGYSRLVNSAIEGEHSFSVKRETIDEYGWRNFGEIYADHEAVFHTGEAPLVSHYNNQYDAIAGFAYQFLRSGNPAWWALMDDLARHVVDIDIYHTDEDWPKYNRGLFWHTVHYKDAGVSTHRTYPRAEGVYGGGPSAGHLYTTGLMLHYFLTGSPQSKEAVLNLADYVIDSDDGSISVLGWIDRGRTGFATASGTADYHGPGRASGNSLNALIDAHRLFCEPRFLQKAGEIIRRAIHPHDHIERRHLLDAENRWFYTMFLQALGKFLWHKSCLGQIDDVYAYAQESLIAYAKWMIEHERPFLDHPEQLEYPTETWPAQDMRKSEVLKWAALNADGDLRARLLERAEYFFQYSINTLTALPTRTLARPVILLLGHGWNHAAFSASVPRLPAGPKGVDFGFPEIFIPQKTRVIRKAAALGVGLGLLALLGMAVAIAAVWSR
jgi:hypothetical protein